MHCHNTKYFLLAREEFQETSIFGKKSEKKKKISKCQRFTYQKNFKATWHFLNQEKQIDFFLGFEMITMNKTQGSPQNAIIFGHSFLHKGSVEELVWNLIFI